MKIKDLDRKTSPEQLEENMKKSLDELDELEKNPPKEEEPPKKPVETEETKEEPEEVIEEEVKETEEEEETEEGIEEETEEKEPKKEIDYKTRYKDSSREAHILFSKSKKFAEVIEQAGDVVEPTEEEMKTEYPDWDMMSDLEKKFAIKDIVNERRFGAIKEATKEFREIDVWNKKVDDYLSDPETLTDNPGLEGKEEDFRIYAIKASHRGADFSVLVPAFLYEEGKQRVEHKGKMFENGNGGLKEKPKIKSNKISVEDSVILRKTNYKEYKRLLEEGLIETEVE